MPIKQFVTICKSCCNPAIWLLDNLAGPGDRCSLDPGVVSRTASHKLLRAGLDQPQPGSDGGRDPGVLERQRRRRAADR